MLCQQERRGKGGRGDGKGVFCRGGQNTNGGGTPYRAAEKPGRMNHREPLSFTDKNQEALDQGTAALPIFHVTITIFLCVRQFLLFYLFVFPHVEI